MQFEGEYTKEAELRFDVIDTGIGIPEDKKCLLFQPFSQLDTSARRRFGGSGLGLAISKRLARMLGGDIEFTSLIGRGSTFSLTIATGPLDGIGFDGQHSISNEPVSAPANNRKKLNCRVLLAEDGLDNQRSIAHFIPQNWCRSHDSRKRADGR